MTEKTKLALIKFSELVATSIARQANGKDVDWREVLDAQELLQSALESELPHSCETLQQSLAAPNAEVSDGGPLTHESPAAQSRRSLH